MVHIIKTLVKDIVILIVAIILIAVAAGFAASAAAKVTKIDDWRDNDKLSQAHSELSWAAVVGWVTIGVLILGGILLAIFLEIDFEIVPFILLFLNIGLIAILIVIGVLCFLGAVHIADANVTDNEGSLTDAVMATLASVGAIIIAIIYFVGKWLYDHYEGKKKKEEEAEAVKEEGQLAIKLSGAKPTSEVASSST